MITLRDITDFLGVKDNIKMFDTDFESKISQPSSLIENSSYPFFLYRRNNIAIVNKVKSELVLSYVKSQERESFDVLTTYKLCSVESNPSAQNFNLCKLITGNGSF